MNFGSSDLSTRMFFTKKQAEYKYCQLWYWFFASEVPLLTYLFYNCYTGTSENSSRLEFGLYITLMIFVAIFFINLGCTISSDTPEYDFESVLHGVPDLKMWEKLHDEKSEEKSSKDDQVSDDEFLKNVSHQYSQNTLYNFHPTFPLGPAYVDLRYLLVLTKNSSSNIDRVLNEWKAKIAKRKDEPAQPVSQELQSLFDDWEKTSLDAKKSMEKIANWIRIIKSHPTFERDFSIWRIRFSNQKGKRNQKLEKQKIKIKTEIKTIQLSF